MYNVLITYLPGDVLGILRLMITKQVDKEHHDDINNYA